MVLNNRFEAKVVEHDSIVEELLRYVAMLFAILRFHREMNQPIDSFEEFLNSFDDRPFRQRSYPNSRANRFYPMSLNKNH